MDTRSVRRTADTPTRVSWSARSGERLRQLDDGRVRWIAAIGLVVAFGIDWLTGPLVSVLFLYSVLPALTTWVAGLRQGIAMAVAATLLASAVRGLHPDAVDGAVTVSINSVLRLLSLVFLIWIVDLQRTTLRQLETSAVTDQLTGAFNRAGIVKRLAAELDRTGTRASLVAVAFFDLDGLKDCNDRDGHDVGDHMLRRFVALVSAELGDQGVLGRIGGDEFVAVLPDTTPTGARRLFDSITALADLPPVSIGVLTVDEATPDDLDSILQQADAAMYAAKHGAGGAVVFAPFRRTDLVPSTD